MKQAPTFNELLDCINNPVDPGRANCSLGFFVMESFAESESNETTSKEIDSFFVKKPVVNISSFMEGNEIYREIRFLFRSLNDSDYKQLWKYLCRFSEIARREREQLEKGVVVEKATTLAISIVPDKYCGKHYAYVSMPYAETISCVENAFDRSAVISLICHDSGFGCLTADDDLIDRRYITLEVEQELQADM